MTDDINKPQKLKKSETLEVRIPYETKQAFLTACREDGTTASEVVRTSVQTYLDERERPQPETGKVLVMKFPQKLATHLAEPIRRYGLRAAAGATAALGLTALAVLPSAAAPDFQAAFKRLDVNGDGVLSAEEFSGRSLGGAKAEDVTATVQIHRSGDAPPAGTPGVKVQDEAYSFWLPPEAGGADVELQQQHEYRVVVRNEVRARPDGAAEPLTFSIENLRQKEFEKFDADKDGKVSFAEFQARQKAMLTRGFEMLDANGDKSLSEAEYLKMTSPPMPKIDGIDIPRVDVASMPRASEATLKAAFAKLDANKDRKLSLQEYLPPA